MIPRDRILTGAQGVDRDRRADVPPAVVAPAGHEPGRHLQLGREELPLAVLAAHDGLLSERIDEPAGRPVAVEPELGLLGDIVRPRGKLAGAEEAGVDVRGVGGGLRTRCGQPEHIPRPEADANRVGLQVHVGAQQLRRRVIAVTRDRPPAVGARTDAPARRTLVRELHDPVVGIANRVHPLRACPDRCRPSARRGHAGQDRRAVARRSIGEGVDLPAAFRRERDGNDPSASIVREGGRVAQAVHGTRMSVTRGAPGRPTEMDAHSVRNDAHVVGRSRVEGIRVGQVGGGVEIHAHGRIRVNRTVASNHDPPAIGETENLVFEAHEPPPRTERAILAVNHGKFTGHARRVPRNAEVDRGDFQGVLVD